MSGSEARLGLSFMSSSEGGAFTDDLYTLGENLETDLLLLK
jgi:hypothetical protein